MHERARRPLGATIVATVYVAWALVAFAIAFANDGLTPANVTHMAIAGYLALSLAAIPAIRRFAGRFAVTPVFIVACMISTAVVETCYMISEPLHPALRISAATGGADALRKLAIDIGLTLPAYAVIFATIAWLLRRFRYDVLEVAVLFSPAQAIGDGSAFFAANPAMLLFLPYLMLNYQAMTLVPYVALEDRMRGEARGGVVLGYGTPLVLIPIVYGICGTLVIAVGRSLAWLPE